MSRLTDDGLRGQNSCVLPGGFFDAASLLELECQRQTTAR